jgi:hypothetical protein
MEHARSMQLAPGWVLGRVARRALLFTSVLSPETPMSRPRRRSTSSPLQSEHRASTSSRLYAR